MGRQSELLEIGAIRRLVDERPTYGYRRIASRAIDNPQGQAPVNIKRVYRLMKKHGLLLECHTGRRLSREHDDQLATIHSNCRRARCLRPRHPGRDLREMICDMMVQCVEKRLAASRAAHPVEWLSGNGLIFAADPTPRNARIEVTGLSETAVRCCGSRLTKLRHDATGSTAKLVRPLERGHFGTDGAKERETIAALPAHLALPG